MNNVCNFHQIGPLGRFGLVGAKSVHGGLCCPLPMRFSQGSKGGPRGAKLSPTVGGGAALWAMTGCK